MVGFGGNNGSTLLATILANKHNICWNTKEGKQSHCFCFIWQILTTYQQVLAAPTTTAVSSAPQPCSSARMLKEPMSMPLSRTSCLWSIPTTSFLVRARGVQTLNILTRPSGGWDISGLPLDQAMKRAKVLDWDLQQKVAPMMADYKPLPSVYYPDFINANQGERADNVLPGDDKAVHLEKLRQDIRDFKAANDLEQVIVLWTGEQPSISLQFDQVG